MYLCIVKVKHELISKTMEKELEKWELHIERLKAAIQMTRRKEEVLEVNLEGRIDDLLKQLSEAIKERDRLKEILKKRPSK